MKFKDSVFLLLGILVAYFYYKYGLHSKHKFVKISYKDSKPEVSQGLDNISKSNNFYNINTQKDNLKLIDSYENKNNDIDSINDLKADKGLKKEKNFDFKNKIRFVVKNDFAISSEDILLGQPKDKKIKTGQTANPSEIKTWPNGEVYFAFDSNISDELKHRVLFALNDFTNKTTIKFYSYESDQKDFIVFSNSDDLCASYVGRIGGAQPIFINSKCQVPEIKHELMHALGFIHEHQRDNRDQYITINNNNIINDKLINFDILPDAYQNIYKHVSRDLDFNSITMYPSDAFTKDKSLNSISIKNSQDKIQFNTDLSRDDIEKINNLYFRKF